MAIQNESSELNSENMAVPVEDNVKPDEPSMEIENGNSDANTNSIATRKALLLIMLIAVILIAVGAITVSLFATQHDWSTGRACLDCHQDVDDEFTNMAALQPHKAMTCPDCHQDLGSGYDDEHGANLPQCISCHPTVETNITYDTEAHKEMYTEAGTYGFNEGGNEACIVCHTGLDIDAVFERPDYYNFTIDSSYSITNVETSSSTHQNTYSYSKIGRLHTYYDGPNVNCSTGGCHQDVDAARGGGVSGGHQTTTQPLNVTHILSSPCTTCHRDSLEVPDTDYHAAKNITCAYRLNGCHDRGDTLVSANMTTMFNQINTAPGMTFQKEGDICWGCHSGYNWLDPVGSGGGDHTFVNYTTDQDNLDHGTITGGTEANTHGAGTEDIQEVDIGGTTIFANYTVASDIGVEGTVSGTAGPPYWQNIVEGEPPAGDIESIQEVAVAAGSVWTTVFSESWNAIYASWPGSATVPAPAQEYWIIVTADANDFNIGNYGNPATQLSLQIRDADAGFAQYAEARDAAGAYFNPAGSSWTDGYVNFSLSATLDIGQSAYFDVWQGGAWVNVPALTVGPAPGNGWNSPWTTYSYQLVALDLAGNQFAWRYWNDGTGNDDIVQFDDITLEVETSSGASASAEHKWTTDSIPAGYTALNLYVRGLSTDPADDAFSIFWSNDDISYLDTGINIDQAAMTTYAPFTFPLGESGILYIQIIDDNTGDVALTTCEIDTIRIQHESLAASQFSLEHRWRTQSLPPGADDLTLIVDARFSAAASDDDFQIGYSTVIGGPYTPVITVNSDVMATYSAGIPVMSGQIYLNVIDTNNADTVQQDTVIIDDIRIMWHDFAPAAGSGLKIQVWTEPDFKVNVWNDTTSAFEQVYPRVVTSCANCHDDYETNRVPFGSGKYINHLNKTVSNYDYTKCGSCHDLGNEPWYPHDVPHNVVIDWTAYASAADTNVGNDFCDVICHYSNFDSRVSPVDYRDASTTWMKDIYTSFTNDGAKHTTSNLIDADGTVECVDCHLNHEQKPDDSDDAITEFQLYGGGSVPGCGDQDLGVDGCHLVNNNTVDATDARETPLSHGDSVPWNSVGRDDCTESGCHDKHNYPLDPSEGHNPSPGACHPGGIVCGSNTNSHVKHIITDWGIPDYDYNCSQCHFNAAGDLDGWYDITYGTAEHNDGTVQVRFNNTAPPTVGIGTYGGALTPTWDGVNLQCSTTYCHSDGNVSNLVWNVVPDWDNPNVACGDCHDVPMTSYAHRNHTANNMPNANPWYDFNCSECHYVSGTLAAGWYDTTYGSIQHVDGQVQVAFNTTIGDSIATFNGVLPAGIYNGDGTCDNIYCHSNGYDIGGAGDIFYTTPAWKSLTSLVCGDCHGVPNLIGNELTTGAHQKHIQNYGGIVASRNLVWFDGIGGTHSYPDADEAILQDDGDFLLDPGFLNVAPDILITDGDAALTDFVAGDNIYWNDDGDGNWEVGEDIWWDNDGNGNSFDTNEDDHRLYNGGANDAGIGGGDPLMSTENDQSIMYLNSDQDDGYYSYIRDVTGNAYDTQYGFDWAYSGSEEPLINVGTAAVATGADLLSTYEVLTPFQGDGTFRSIGYWFDDMQAWYDYDCSECHYNNPPTVGYGSYGTSLHVNANYDVFTSGDPAGVSTYFGTYTPVYLPGTKECGVVYCHSDAQFTDGSDGNPDFAGPSGSHVEDDTDTIAPDNTDYHPTYPDWDNPATVSCGSGGTSCHYAGDEDSTMPVGEHPNTGVHQRGGHVDADQSGWKSNNYDTWCFQCHFDEDGGPNYYYHPYGMPTHVDGSILIDSAAVPWFNPITAARGDPCHDAIGRAGWRGPYPGGGC